MSDSKGFFKQSRVREITGLSDDLLRTYENEFNIQVERTSGGHRRYTEENIELFIRIKEKIQTQNWTYDDVRRWMNGEATPKALEDTQIRLNVEKKVENLEEKVDMLVSLNENLVKKLDEQNQFYQNQLKEQENRIVDAIEKRLSDPIEKRTLELTNQLSQSLEHQKLLAASIEEDKNKGNFFSRLFKKKKT